MSKYYRDEATHVKRLMLEHCHEFREGVPIRPEDIQGPFKQWVDRNPTYGKYYVNLYGAV